jgi:hypothetical protein
MFIDKETPVQRTFSGRTCLEGAEHTQRGKEGAPLGIPVPETRGPSLQGDSAPTAFPFWCHLGWEESLSDWSSVLSPRP